MKYLICSLADLPDNAANASAEYIQVPDLNSHDVLTIMDICAKNNLCWKYLHERRAFMLTTMQNHDALFTDWEDAGHDCPGDLIDTTR